MKKLLLGITVLAVFFMVGTTVLAGSSAPKSLCYKWGGGHIPVAMMTLKSLGTIKTADGSVKHYAIHGTQLYPGFYPPSAITGTATFVNGILRFNHTTITRSDGTPGSDPVNYWQITSEGTFDIAMGTGALTAFLLQIPAAAGTVTVRERHNELIDSVDCSGYSIDSLSANASLAVPEEGLGRTGMLKSVMNQK